MTSSDVERARSASDLLEAYHSMSIPHFQRGLVWDTSSVALLLESIYYETPCGSIILWEPQDITPHGNALVKGSAPKYLIVDGQQRIRSLHGVFGDEDEEAAAGVEDDLSEVGEAGVSGEGGDERAEGVWCLNLGRVPELEAQFPGGKRFRIFRKTRDPRDQFAEQRGKNVRGAPLQDLEALLPIQWFRSQDDDQIRQLIQAEGPDRAIAKAAQAVLEQDTVRDRLRGMWDRQVFHVTVLGPRFTLADVVGVYNRINSAGKRVEAEEKAFANLVAEGEDAHASLRTFFDGVNRLELPAESRDDLLHREKENRFGFKLFMRVFTIALAYHTDRTIGRAGFSFESASAETLAEARLHLRSILETTSRVLIDVARMLRASLYCDDFRTLPETASLWPLFQLMIRFPGLLPKATPALASIALRLMLANMTKN